jgi:UDP-3-O-[3-hydroxymyristoyl] glucosamine N-acyltransferase
MNELQKKPSFKLSELTKDLDVVIKGDDCLISGVSPIQDSSHGHITFLTNPLYSKHLETTKASAVILHEKDADKCPLNVVISRNPHYVYAKIAEFFSHQPEVFCGVHDTVTIGNDCKIDPSASIGPHCVIGNQVKIGANVVIGAGSIIGNAVEIDEASLIDPRVTIYYKVKIGKRVRISSGAVIGSDGFGFANEKGRWHKVPQLGTVVIGDDVDVGSNTTIDRGAIENTIIASGVKLDNLIQIGHNVQIGENTIVAGCTGIAGSTTIGKNCMIGGAVMINGHISIIDNVLITAGTGVSKSIRLPGIYSSGMAAMPNHEFRKNSARINRLEQLMQRVKTLEMTLKELREKNHEAPDGHQ